MITDEQLTKFIDLYFQRFGIKLTKENALKKALGLVDLMKPVLKEILIKKTTK